MSSSSSIFKTVFLRGGQTDVLLVSAGAMELAVTLQANVSLFQSARISFDPQAGTTNIDTDSFLMGTSDGAISFMLAAGQSLYASVPPGIQAGISVNAYPLSPADAPYLI